MSGLAHRSGLWHLTLAHSNGNNSGNENTNDDDENSNNEWDDMYMAYKENHSSGDEDNNNSDGGADKGGNGSENNGDMGEDGNGLGNNSDEDGNGLDDIGNGEDGNGGKKIGRLCEFGGKDKGRNDTGMKRKIATQADNPATATRAKRTKMDGGRNHQAATKSTKKAALKRKPGKKQN